MGVSAVRLARKSLGSVVICCFVPNMVRFDVGESEVCFPAVVIGWGLFDLSCTFCGTQSVWPLPYCLFSCLRMTNGLCAV